MDEVMSRPKIRRASLPAKRRGKSTKESGMFLEKLLLQLAAAIFLLALVGIFKGIHTTPTNYVTEKVKWVLSQNLDIQDAYSGIQNFLNKLAKKGSKDVSSAEEQGTPDVSEKELTKDTGIAPNAASSRIQEIKQKDVFTLPVIGAVSSPFGDRIHPLTKVKSFHQGVDLEANQGDAIKAALDGLVFETGNSPVNGNYIKLEHKDGIMTLYAHCSKLLVKKGAKVKQGDVIANVGSTGLAVGAHLHFEVWLDGTPVDPLNFIHPQG